ncbi:MAG: LamG domain-containing protein [Candidatus Cloacimonadaceae bacterium]
MIVLSFSLGNLFCSPQVNNLFASQRSDSSKKVDIYYNLIHDKRVTVSVYASQDNGATWNLPITQISGDFGSGIDPGNGKHIIWDVLAEHPNIIFDNVKFKVVADDGVIDLASGLVAYYPFNGNANDVSGCGNHGSVSGSVLCPDRFGVPNKAYYFSGNNNFITINHSNVLNLQDMTLSLWVKFDRTNTGEIFLSKGMFPDYNYKFEIYYNYLRFIVGLNNDQSMAQVRGYQTGVWYFLTGTHDGNTLKLYINGNLANSIPCVGLAAQNTYPLILGKYVDGGYCFKGTLDDIRVYNRVLADSEIMSLYLGD